MKEPRGFWEVVGFEPYVYAGVTIRTATFAVEASAQKFVSERGGEVTHRDADGIMVKDKIVPVRA